MWTVPFTFSNILFIIIAVWNLLLTGFLLLVLVKYRRLVKGSEGRNLIDLVGKLVEKTSDSERRLLALELETRQIGSAARSYLQSVGLFRFNPFNEVGGAHSFAAAFLDKDGNGLVVSSLYGREGSRLYAKLIKKGEGVDYELSGEEKKSIKMANLNPKI